MSEQQTLNKKLSELFKRIDIYLCLDEYEKSRLNEFYRDITCICDDALQQQKREIVEQVELCRKITRTFGKSHQEITGYHRAIDDVLKFLTQPKE